MSSATTAPVVTSKLHPTVQNIISSIIEMLGIDAVAVKNPNFSLKLETTPDGNGLFARLYDLGFGGAPLFEKVIDPNTISGNNGSFTTAGSATLAAGKVNIPLVSKSTDLLVARVVTAAGTPGAYLAVNRLSASVVQVVSLTSGNVVASSDTSKVNVYNFGTPAT